MIQLHFSSYIASSAYYGAYVWVAQCHKKSQDILQSYTPIYILHCEHICSTCIIIHDCDTSLTFDTSLMCMMIFQKLEVIPEKAQVL